MLKFLVLCALAGPLMAQYSVYRIRDVLKDYFKHGRKSDSTEAFYADSIQANQILTDSAYKYEFTSDSEYVTRGELQSYQDISEVLVSWIIDAEPESALANPTDEPYAFAFKVQLLSEFTLNGYGYGLTDTGGPTDGALFIAMWSHDSANNCPDTRVDSTRAVAFMDEEVPGWQTIGLNETSISGDITYTFEAGIYWVVVTVDQEGDLNIDDPPMEWAFGLACGYGHGYYIALDGAAGWVSGTWDTANDVPWPKVPRIYLL